MLLHLKHGTRLSGKSDWQACMDESIVCKFPATHWVLITYNIHAVWYVGTDR